MEHAGREARSLGSRRGEQVDPPNPLKLSPSDLYPHPLDLLASISPISVIFPPQGGRLAAT